MVFSGLVTACRLATWPTSRSPLFVIATTEGVKRDPSLFSSTVGSPASITATTELVVPRSMPITLAITYSLLYRICQVPPVKQRICLTSTSPWYPVHTFSISLPNVSCKLKQVNSLYYSQLHNLCRTCHYDLSRANYTLSQGIAGPGYLQDSPLGHI